MNYPRCTLASIITPGIYRVVSKEEEHITEVEQVEELLAKEIQHAPIHDFNLDGQMCVAVETTNGKTKRGVIEGKVSNTLYKVLLIDYGETITVDKSQIHIIINESHLNVEPLSFIVKLFGVFPCKFYMVNENRKARVTQNWQPESEAFVKNLFVNFQEVIVQSLLIKQRIVYGDIFLEVEPKRYTSLRKLLCKKEFCAYSKTNFLRHEGLDLPLEESSNLEAKMEFVRKWQMENFKDFQALPFSFSHSVGIMNSPPESSEKKINELKTESSEKKIIELKTESSEKKINELKTESSELPSGFLKKSATGRGKIQTIISHMKEKQGTSSINDETNSSESHSVMPCTLGLTSKGKDLKQLEININLNLKDKNWESDSKPDNGGCFDDADSPTTDEKVENPFVQFWQSSQISKDSSTENWISEDGLPPLIRKNPVDIQFVKQSKKVEIHEENTETKTNSKKSENPKILSHEIKILKSEDEKWSSHKSTNRWVDLDVPLKISLKKYWSPFVIFNDSVVEPIDTFGELAIVSDIIQNLQKGGTFNELSQIQRWAIPTIRKQHNTVVIASSKTGKTLSYLIPLIDYIQDEFYFEELPEGNGPAIVIVASSSRVCESIYYMSLSLLGNVVADKICNSKIRIVLAHGNGCEKEVWVKLTNGCDILISTPHCLTRLLEYPILTNFERLTCLVLDEVDIISQKHFKKKVQLILEKAKLSTKNRHYQNIFCGEKWVPGVENLVKKYNQTYALIIGSYLEALIYKRFKPAIYLVLQNQKIEILLEKIKDKVGKMKILIMCESATEAIFVNEYLTEKNISSLVAHEDLMAGKLKEIRSSWKACPKLVLVLTDEVLSEMKIREAQVLVHYGLPAKSKTNFFLRYSAFENFIPETHRIQQVQNKDNSSKLIDIILVDEDSHFQLPHIVDFVMRLGGKVPKNLLQKCEEIQRIIEVSKKNKLICRNLLTFGHCQDSKSCSQRHAFIKSSDSPGKLPSSGWVNFNVIKVHDASSISVRLFEHVDASMRVSKLDDRFMEIPVKLADVFKKEENRRPHGTPFLGDICAVKSEILNQEVFYRAQVVEYLKMDKHDMPCEVNVRLIDQGDFWNRKKFELYELPKELSEYPPIAVDVKVVGLQPLDFDANWSQIANTYVNDVLTQTLEENQYWSGKIVLALNGTLFLNPIKRKEFLPHLNTHVFDLVLQEHLIDNRVAVKNEEHLPSLLKLCQDEGIEIPREEELKKEDTAKILPQWAFFDSDFVEVKFLSAIHTSNFFLQQKKFEKLLDQLEADCQSEGKRIRKEISQNTKKSATFNLTVGSFCLAKFEDGKWNRGRIDNETNSSFYIFFIDHGDFLSVPKTDVIPISQSLLLRLPCQAIECSLIGVRPEAAECPIEVLHEMYDFSDDGKLYLYALIVEKTKAEITSGQKYRLNLLNQKGMSLNKSLVLSGKVTAEESEKRHLEDIEIVLENEKNGLDDDPEEEINETVQEISMTEYFEGFGDDVFINEEGRAFLKEFSSKYLLRNSTHSHNQRTITYDSEKVEMLQQAHTTTDSTSLTKSEIINENVQKHFSKKSLDRKKNVSLIKHDKILTPQVLWSQNHSEVRLKIIVQNVQDYALECTATNFAFRCFMGEKLYALDFKLYGSINPQLTKLTLKAFHVIIILTKLVSPFWPMLYRDEGKHRWINLDVESLTDKGVGFAEVIKSVKRDLGAGIVKEGVGDVKIYPCSDSEEGEDELLESESETD